MRSVKIVIFLLLVSLPAWGANIYVDQLNDKGATWDGVNGHSYVCSHGTGTGYTTIQAAVNAMNGGDDIYMRGGTYSLGGTAADGSEEAVNIPVAKNGTSGNWSSIQSYPAEWAILDGGDDCGNRGVGLGHYDADFSSANDLAYWLFERFEITNCQSVNTQDGGSFSYGLFVSGGPFKIRYLYVHDNNSNNGVNNPFGVGGYHWHDTICEYNYIIDNGGSSASYDDNSANIGIFTDYGCSHDGGSFYTDTLAYGYQGGTASHVSMKSNIIRYNYIHGSPIGIKHKAYQVLSGRNTANGFPASDAYEEYGDKIHHNIIVDSTWIGILAHQDFVQIYNNIVDIPTGDRAISLNYDSSSYPPLYKATVYNNTIRDAYQSLLGLSYYGAILSMGNQAGCGVPVADQKVYEYHYNNLIDGCRGNTAQEENVGTQTTKGEAVLTNNYFYRSYSSNTNFVRFLGTTYNQSGWEGQTASDTPRTLYANAYDAGNLLYAGTIGANKYIPASSGSHTIESGVTIANGGIGGSHPYLSGVTIPSYVGAVNPSDSDWVAGVLAMDATYFTSQTAGSDPTWIEGSGSSPSTPSFTGVMTGSIR